MKIRLHKNFEKQFKKLKISEKNKTKQKLKLFVSDPSNQILNSHPLKGKYSAYRSINITGDIRAIYKHISENECIFITIDSHSNLYK